MRSPYITCNAAIYPGVTYFGDSFEPTHDCLYLKIDRDIRSKGYIPYFKEIVFNQADEQLREIINKQMGHFITIAYACGGNPRILLRSIQNLSKFNSNAINNVVKDYYRGAIWDEHTELGEKYKGHKVLIDWGRDFLEKTVLPAIKTYNLNRQGNNIPESSIYFWVHKDCPETVKESLRLLS